MKINLISLPEQTALFEIFQLYPNLRLQNNGYEYLDKSKFDNEDLKAFNFVESILKKSIIGFSKFHNFRTNINNKIQLRFDYNWNYEDKKAIPFYGVGYIYLTDLYQGFNN